MDFWWRFKECREFIQFMVPRTSGYELFITAKFFAQEIENEREEENRYDMNFHILGRYKSRSLLLSNMNYLSVF